MTSFAQRHKSNVFTESDYTTDTLRMEGYTYICDTLKHARVTLRNIEDHPGRQGLSYADGTPLESKYALDLRLETVVVNNETGKYLHEIVDNAFSQEQAESLNGKKLHVVLNISSTNGEVTDVYFSYMAHAGYAKIPIEVYRDMEVQFKNDICFELTDLGRKLNYCLLSWSQCPKGRVEESPEEETEDEGGTNNGDIKTDLGGVATDRGTISGTNLNKGIAINP